MNKNEPALIKTKALLKNLAYLDRLCTGGLNNTSFHRHTIKVFILPQRSAVGYQGKTAHLR